MARKRSMTIDQLLAEAKKKVVALDSERLKESQRADVAEKERGDALLRVQAIANRTRELRTKAQQLLECFRSLQRTNRLNDLEGRGIQAFAADLNAIEDALQRAGIY
jgi:hypothetical protein